MEYAFIGFVTFLGYALKVLEKARTIPDMTAIQYITEDYERLAISLINIVLMLLVANEAGQLNLASAIGAGYLGESGARFIQQLRGVQHGED